MLLTVTVKTELRRNVTREKTGDRIVWKEKTFNSTRQVLLSKVIRVHSALE